MSTQINSLQRTSSGHWLPGTTGNPNGYQGHRNISLLNLLKRKIGAAAQKKRKKGQEVSDYRIANEIVDELVWLCMQREHLPVKQAAIATVLDRIDGKPLQRVEMLADEKKSNCIACYNFLVAKCHESNMPVDSDAIIAAMESQFPDAREMLAEVIQ